MVLDLMVVGIEVGLVDMVNLSSGDEMMMPRTPVEESEGEDEV